MPIWTLTVDGPDFNIATSVHSSEASAIASLRKRYFKDDEDAPALDEDLLYYATERNGYVIYIDVHELP